MTATEMEHLSPPVEQAALPAPEPYSPPPPMPRLRPRRSWRTFIEGRERRLWTASLAGALLVAVAGIGAVYLDDTTNQATIRSLTTQNESLTGRNQNLNDQLKTTQSNLTATLGELAQTKADLAHPHLTIWNVPQQLKGSSWYLAGGIPDTFTYHLQATSTGPMSVSILTLEQWAKAIQCIDNGGGSTHYCMHHSGAVIGFQNTTAVSYDFHLAEGCADYLAVFTSASTVTVTPDVSVTYNPATSPTGVCS
jgi:cell division protein FtsB